MKRDLSVDLQFHKAYRIIKDSQGNSDGLIRIIDESGEDYLYPAKYFQLTRKLLVFNPNLGDFSSFSKNIPTNFNSSRVHLRRLPTRA